MNYTRCAVTITLCHIFKFSPVSLRLYQPRHTVESKQTHALFHHFIVFLIDGLCLIKFNNQLTRMIKSRIAPHF